LKLVARAGFPCKAFTASKLDLPGEQSVEQLLVDRGYAIERREHVTDTGRVHLLRVRSGEFPITIFRCRSSMPEVWFRGEREALLAEFDRTIRDFRPQVLLTYGGDAVAREMIRCAEGNRQWAVGSRVKDGIKIVFWLHNFAYQDRELFRDVDRVIVPSEFSRQWYRERLGLECDVLPYAIDWERVVRGQESEGRGQEETSHPGPLPASGARESDPSSQPSTLNSQRYVTFVNPVPAKGLYVFARIAEQIARRRPDIPMLVVEGRGRASWLEQVPIDLSWATNLYAMENTHAARDFYAVTKILLVPSLWNESFGLVAAEAMINGIPVLASNRGALPDVVGDAGFLFEVPSKYTPDACLVPSAEEVEPWVTKIMQLWDDPISFDDAKNRAVHRAQSWHSYRLGSEYETFFAQTALRRDRRPLT
jgi:glycosyltransferase involved in cell wall biosynthesis